MFFKRIYEPGLAQVSYIIGCQTSGEAMVIDPRRDIDVYLKTAHEEKLTISHIVETHIHADFLSGSRELAIAANAGVYLSAEGGLDWRYQFAHNGMREGDTLHMGNLKIEVLHTPGHTPEHISLLVTDQAASEEPVMIFTGDFVFVGDVGRPDLLEEAAGMTGTKEQSAHDVFHSLKKFRSLPDHIQVWPAHGAGSACGKALGAIPVTTVGYEKFANWALQIEDESAFVHQLLAGQPEAPTYFKNMKIMNKAGAALLGQIPQPARLTLQPFLAFKARGVQIIDARDREAFAKGHIPGSINIQDNSAFSTWAGWMIDYQQSILLIAEDRRIEELTKALLRIGLDNIIGYLPDPGLWKTAGNRLESSGLIESKQLQNQLQTSEIQLIDVRNRSEFNEGHIPGAEHLQAGQLKKQLSRVSGEKPVVLYCASGDRSSIALSLLQAKGYDNVQNLSGGIDAWQSEGLPVEQPREASLI